MRIHAQRSKRSLTLIELMVVISLIAIGLGALSWPFSKALKQEQFERGVERVIEKMTLAQEIMLDFHTDVVLSLQGQEGGISCLLEAARPLTVQIEKGLNSGACLIKGIQGMALNHIPCATIELRYEASLGVAPKGIITFFNGPKEKSLYLKGYPAGVQQEEDETPTNQAHYPEEILSSL